MYYLVGIFRTLSLGRQHLKQTQENHSKDVKGELGYIGVLQQRTGSPEHQRSWLKKTRYPKWRNWALFYLREDAGVWAHWNLPLDMHLSSLGPLYPLHITSFFSSGCTAGSDCSQMADERESRSVVSDSLRPHGLYSPWNSPGLNTGVGSLSLLQGIFPIQESNQGLLHCRRILYRLSYEGSYDGC